MGVPPHDKNTIELVPIVERHDRAEFLGLVGPAQRPLQYYEELAKVAGGKTIAFCYHGGQHYSDFVFEREPFDFIPASRPGLPLRGYPLVPESLIRAHFAAGMGLLEYLMKRLTVVPDSHIVVLGTPPSRRENESALHTIRGNRNFAELAKSAGLTNDDLRLLDDFVLLKLWFVIQDMMREIAEQHGAQFIEVPPQTQDEYGALLRQYWLPYDVTHANLQYGRVFLDHIVDRLGHG
ncbi:MAG: hypothetical protein DLM68_06190 [Hyphomicrobiales bacterium]|nr:MAG: hypothetical protein DLM68_06190 [Hyphomicrobiales bacterium]